MLGLNINLKLNFLNKDSNCKDYLQLLLVFKNDEVCNENRDHINSLSGQRRNFKLMLSIRDDDSFQNKITNYNRPMNKYKNEIMFSLEGQKNLY